jgi:very-short-patch-repair endonuclease
MRLVVVFFAEARELLPVDSPVYHRGYGLKGLLEALERAGTDRRKTHRQAWPRLLALFRLLHRGSPHPSLIVPTYGGDLFRPHPLPPLPKGRGGALSLIEDMSQPPSDEVVYRMLTLLTRTTERLREGSATRTVAVPVDFTELTSEYIGILYEGLLDYELHRVGEEPVVFLSIGDQPALPLDRLEAMTDKQLQALVEKANVKGEASDDEEESSEDAEDVEDETSPHGPFSLKGEGESDDEPANLDDIHSAAMRRALAWAERAAIAAKLVRASKKNDPKHRTEIEKAAQQLIARVMLPGELYVVRWGGTRKGAGTFYTRPQLTLPTVRRTLEPLFFTPNPTSPPCPLSLSGEGENSEVFLAPCPFRERAGGEVGQVSITRHAHVSAEKLELARKMRQLPTETEARAWELLRDRRCLGLKFRRQQVIRGFIVDFYCAERRLAIELDGEVHASQQEYDQARDAALNAVGVSVVRIANHQLSKQHLETLLSSYLTPTSLSLKGEGAKDTFELSPSPEGRGGRGVRCEEARGVRSGELSYRTPKRSFRSRSAIQRWARALSSSLPCAC